MYKYMFINICIFIHTHLCKPTYANTNQTKEKSSSQ